MNGEECCKDYLSRASQLCDSDAEPWARKAAEIADDLPSPRTRCIAFCSYATVLRSLGQTKKAEPWARKAAEIADDLPDPYTCCVAYFSYATVLRGLGQLKEAEPWARKLAEIADDLPDPDARCIVYHSYANALRGLGQMNEAEPWAQKAAEIADDLPDPLARCIAYYTYANVLRGLGRDGKAEPWGRKAAKLANDLPNPHTRCIAYYSYANALRGLGQMKEAEPWAHKAAEIADDLPDPYTRCKAYMTFANVLRGLGRDGKAEPWARKAVELADDLDDPHTRCMTYYDYANALRGLGQMNKAEPWARKAAKLAADLPNPHTRCNAYMTYANVLRGLGQLKEAEPWAQKAAEIADDLPDPLTRCIAYYTYANALRDLRRDGKAELWARKAAEIAADLTDPHTRCNAYFAYATVLRGLGQVKEAEPWARKAVELAGDLPARHTRSKAYTCYAEVLFGLGQLKEAEPWAQKAAEIADDLPNSHTRCNAALTLAVLAAEPVQAARHFASAQAHLLTELSQNRHVKGVANILAIYGWMFADGLNSCERSWTSAQNSATEMLWQGLEFTDGAKCVTIREGLRRHAKRATKPTKTTWRAAPADWKSLFHPPDKRGSISGPGGAVRGMIGSQARQASPVPDLGTNFEKPGDIDEAKNLYCRPIDPEGISRLLPDRQTVVVPFFFDHDDLVILPFRKDQRKRPRLLHEKGKGYFRVRDVRPALEDLVKYQEEFLDAIVQPKKNDPGRRLPLDERARKGKIRALYADLYAQMQMDRLLKFIEPSGSRRRKLHLVLVPDGPLYQLALHAAVAADGTRLYEQVASVRYGLSLRTLDLQQEIEAERRQAEDRDRELRGVAYANPDAKKRYGPSLAKVRDEVAALVEETRADQWWLHGERPGKQAAIRKHLRDRHPSGNVGWWMGHGGKYPDKIKVAGRAETVQEAAFALCDGPVSMSRMLAEGYDFRSYLLVNCSCCLLGRLDPVGASKEVIGFMAALTLLGCRRVASALWQLCDDSAPDFTRYWIRAIKEHVFERPRGPHSFAIAFKHALDDFRSSCPQFDHEFFWAPYMLYGLG